MKNIEDFLHNLACVFPPEERVELTRKWQKEIRQEYDEALREKMIQQLWFAVKRLPGKNPKIELSVVERIINEVEI